MVGVSVQESRSGLIVAGVTAGSGAEKAGLQEYDLIVKVDGQAVKTSKELNEIRDKKSPGDTITFTIVRNGELMDVPIVLTEETPSEEN